MLNKLNFDSNEGVHISDSKTIEFEMVRTSLIPGLLKSVSHNGKEGLP